MTVILAAAGTLLASILAALGGLAFKYPKRYARLHWPLTGIGAAAFALVSAYGFGAEQAAEAMSDYVIKGKLLTATMAVRNVVPDITITTLLEFSWQAFLGVLYIVQELIGFGRDEKS